MLTQEPCIAETTLALTQLRRFWARAQLQLPSALILQHEHCVHQMLTGLYQALI